MKLHIGNLYWPSITETKKLNIKKDFLDRENEILIVGGGISGAISAYRLSKEGYNVTLIEQAEIGYGSTSANTGLIQYMSDKGICDFSKQIGKEKASNFYLDSVKAVNTLIKINDEVEQLKTETFKITESLILATEEKKITDVKNEVETQKSLGIDAKYLNQSELENLNIDAFGALKAAPDINLNPFGFVNRLIYKSINEYGLVVIENAKFKSLKQDSNSLDVIVELDGKKLNRNFNKVIFATGYNPPEFLLSNLNKLQLNKTYVTVSKNDVDIKEAGNFLTWEVKTPYTYFKKTFEDKVMIGGLDEEGEELIPEKIKSNESKLIELTKEMLIKKDITIEPEYSYTAIFGESEDDLPYMGVLPENNNIFVICGVGGNGTVYSTIASEIILKWLKNENLDGFDIFRLGR